MKRQLFILMIILLPVASWAQFGMNPPEDTDKVSGGAQLGSVTADGKTWSQFGFRMDLPIWKFGLGLDLQVLLDAEGNIREADWDEWQDYLDKIYYVRFGKKNKDPFYVKFGSLDYATIGYGNIVDRYTNMIEYPTYRRWGMEMALKGEKLGFEMLLNDYKELAMEDMGMMVAGRFSYKPIGKLEIGVSAAADLNEYNGLRDSDDDGIPDEIDEYVYDKSWATRRDYYVDGWTEIGIDTEDHEKLIALHNGDPNNSENKIGAFEKSELFNKKEADPSTSLVYSVDIGYPIIEGETVGLKIFSHFTQIQDHGWGITAPGAKLNIGKFLTVTAEYRHSSEEFVFGYINSTYDLERAVFRQAMVDGVEKLTPYTKSDKMGDTNEAFNGYFVGADLKIGSIAQARIEYQDLIGDNDLHMRTLRGSAGLQSGFIPMIKSLEAYYLQNNVEDFQEWRTPSTVIGAIFDYNVGGATMGIDYRLTFQDRDGDGLIRGSEETIKTISFRTRVTF